MSELWVDAYADYFSLGVRAEERHGALFLRRDSTPHVWDANHVRRIRTPGGRIDALFEEAEDWFASLPYRAFRVDPWTPRGVEARLLQADFRCQLDLLLACEGPVVNRPADVRFEPVESEADWSEWWTLKRAEMADRELLSLGGEWLDHIRSKCPPLRYWLARWEGVAVGFLSELVTREVGILDDLYVDPGHRGRNVGAALLAHCADRARSRGAGTLVIPVNASETPKHLYAKLGFRPAVPLRLYQIG